jgi:hypothetical protein
MERNTGMAFESTSAISASSTPVKFSQRIPGSCFDCQNTPLRDEKAAHSPFAVAGMIFGGICEQQD